MADFQAKARDYAAKADKKMKSFSFFGNKYEDAADLYEKAANQYKLAKACTSLFVSQKKCLLLAACASAEVVNIFSPGVPGVEAGETFMKLAEVHVKLESKHDAASCWVEASKAFMKVEKQSTLFDTNTGCAPGVSLYFFCC